MQLSPYHAGLAGRHGTRLPMPPAFATCSCPLWLSPSGKSMTQESPFELLLTQSRIQHRVPRRTVSLHPAQASQRPCEGPVSMKKTCWLHDTRRKSMPLRGREHQWHEATVICNTFSTDSSVVLVPRHRREVCPLARRVMLPTLRAQPVSTPLQGGLRFFPPLYPHCHRLALRPPSLTWRSNTGLPRSARLTRMGEVLSIRRKRCMSMTGDGRTSVPATVPFGSSLSASLACQF